VSAKKKRLNGTIRAEHKHIEMPNQLTH